MSARLGVCVPTYNRASDLAVLLDCLAREAGDRDDVTVLIADNASDDGTAELLRAAAPAHPWLRVHRHEQNLGAAGNMGWLVEHAPPCEHLWLFGDDDVIVDGGLRTIIDLLVAERPSWLFLPHVWVDEAGRPAHGSPAPGTVERYADGGDLYRAYHHWLTFLSASIVRTGALQEAVRAIRTDNSYVPLLWFFRAGLEGPCVVAADHLIHASPTISWADRAHLIQTLDFTSLYDEGLHAGLSEEEFGATLDGLYRNQFTFQHWRRVPVERLAAVVARFPQSDALRAYLWNIAREQERRDVLPVLDEAARRMGRDAEAHALVQAGEAAFADGDAATAARSFMAAAERMPTSATAWSNLAVALHSLDHADAGDAVEHAVFLAPDDPDARINRGSIRLARGDWPGAVADASHVVALQPDNADALELLELARR